MYLPCFAALSYVSTRSSLFVRAGQDLDEQSSQDYCEGTDGALKHGERHKDSLATSEDSYEVLRLNVAERRPRP